MCHSSTRPGTSYHVTQFYQAFPHVSTASDKYWARRPRYEASVLGNVRTVKQSGSQSLTCVCLEEMMDRFEVPHILCKIPVIEYANITPIPGCAIWERITQVLYDSIQIACSYSIIFVCCFHWCFEKKGINPFPSFDSAI